MTFDPEESKFNFCDSLCTYNYLIRQRDEHEEDENPRVY